MAGLYRDLLAVRTWGFNNFDPAQSWKRRREARQASARLRKSTKAYLQRVVGPVKSDGGLIPKIMALMSGDRSPAATAVEAGSLRWYGMQVATQLLTAGESYEKVADILMLCGVAGVGNPISQV
jgi:hypothetical protein